MLIRKEPLFAIAYAGLSIFQEIYAENSFMHVFIDLAFFLPFKQMDTIHCLFQGEDFVPSFILNSYCVPPMQKET